MSGRVKVAFIGDTFDGAHDYYNCRLGGVSMQRGLPQQFTSRVVLATEDNQLLAVFLTEEAALEAAAAINGADTPDMKLGRAARTLIAAFREHIQ